MTAPPDLSSSPRARIGEHDEEMSFVDMGGRRAFTVTYHPRPGARAASFGAVVAHSFGFEQLTLRAAEVMASRALADAGVPVLYLHAQGYGDSSGSFADVGLDSHVRDAGVAIDLLRERFPVERVLLLGARYGAAVALLTAEARPDDVHAVAAVHPLVRGKSWFESMLRSAAVGALTQGGGAGPKAMRARMESEGWLDLHGYPVHRHQFEEGTALDLTERLSRAPADALVLQVTRPDRSDRDVEKLAAKLEELGSRVTTDLAALEPGQDFALPVPHAVTPLKMRSAFERIVEATMRWVEGLRDA